MNQKRSRRFQFFVLLAAVTCAQAQNKELTRLRLAATETSDWEAVSQSSLSLHIFLPLVSFLSFLTRKFQRDR